VLVPHSNRPRAALYARVSTAAQDKGDPWASLPRQLEDMRALAVRSGFIEALAVEEQGSGAKADRPGWARVLAAARAGEVDVILAVAFDRLTRSERIGDFEDLKLELRGLKVRLATVKGGEMDLSGTADAETRSDFDAVLSKRERLVIKERTMRGRQAKGEAGGYTGHQAPYGYLTVYDPTTGAKRFVVDEPRAAIVREVFERFAAGERLADLARWVTRNPEAPPLINLKGEDRHWDPTQVRALLRQPLYGGWSSWQRRRQKGAAPRVRSTAFAPLVNEDLWDAVQARVALYALRAPRGARPANPLSGILRCSACGYGLTFQPSPPTRPSSPSTYNCPRSSRTQYESPCTKGQFLNSQACEATVHAYLLEHLGAYLQRHLDLEAIDAHARVKKATPRRDETAALEKRKATLQGQQAKVGTKLALEDDEAVGAGLRAALQELAAELNAVDLALATARQQGLKAANTRAVTRSMAARLELLERVDLADRETLRLVFDSFLARVTLEKVSEPRQRQVLRVASCELRDGGAI
jgi:DNA invertase Pin-like site-specific DNA recombinase